WYEIWKFWRPLPAFEPLTFRADLDKLRQLHRNRGYYHARITYDLELPAEGNKVRAVVTVEQGPPVFVESVMVSLEGAELPAAERALLLDHLPVARDQVFSEDAYARAFTYLRTYYREHGFARVQVERRAEVDVRRDAAAATTPRSRSAGSPPGGTTTSSAVRASSASAPAPRCCAGRSPPTSSNRTSPATTTGFASWSSSSRKRRTPTPTIGRASARA